MRFVSDTLTLLNTLPPLTGDGAKLAHRLAQAIDLIEIQRQTMRAAYGDIQKRYDVQAANRLANELQREDAPST